MQTFIIDTPNDTRGHYAKLKSMGIKTIIRYASLNHSWKTISANEATNIASNGMRLGLVFEYDGKPHEEWMGRRDGHAAFSFAVECGAPNGSVIWYAVDYDPSPSDMAGIIAAFRAFKNEVGPRFRVGAYCSGYCADKLVFAGCVDNTIDRTTNHNLPLIWIAQSKGWRGSLDYLNSGKPFVMFQLMPGTKDHLDVDPNITFHNYQNEDIDIGDFVPFSGDVHV